jgi:hypothetical protein
MKYLLLLMLTFSAFAQEKKVMHTLEVSNVYRIDKIEEATISEDGTKTFYKFKALTVSGKEITLNCSGKSAYFSVFRRGNLTVDGKEMGMTYNICVKTYNTLSKAEENTVEIVMEDGVLDEINVYL